jgi:cobaltochelatase CobN
VLDLWGSATTRTGGEEIAQALALMGVRPHWDVASNRVSGFDILPLAALERGRVDVTLRISGLFRDAYPGQIALLDAAVQAVAQLDEPRDENPLAAARVGAARIERIFGAAPGVYGIGLARAIAANDFAGRDDLAEIYLGATDHAYSGEGEAVRASGAYAERIRTAEAYAHVQDLPGVDVLSDAARADHEGGFAAAALALKSKAALYHVDATRAEGATVRPLRRELARALRGRAAHPRWLDGQMRHGWRGAMEIADGADNLFAFAALSECVESRQFDVLFDATLGDERVRDFLMRANPEAARGMAERFREAERRGFWTARRNSSGAILESMLSEAA